MTCNCLNWNNRTASEVEVAASAVRAVVTEMNRTIRRKRVTIGACCRGGDHDIFLVRYGFSLLFIFLLSLHGK